MILINENRGFQQADKHAYYDKIICAGVEVVPVLELIIRKLEDAKSFRLNMHTLQLFPCFCF